MMEKKRMWLSIVWLILGVVLLGLGVAEKVDAFWSGMGGALMAIGAVRLLRYYRLNKNESYREKMEIEMSDERNHFLRNKAWAWAGYLFVLTLAVLSIVLRIFGQELLSQAAGFAVCFMLVLYWGSYMVLSKKY